MLSPLLAQFPPEVSIGGYAGARLIVLGLLTAIAAVGYSGIVGPSVVVAPTLMKIAFLLVLGGIIVPLLVSAERGQSDQTAGEELSHDD